MSMYIVCNEKFDIRLRPWKPYQTSMRALSETIPQHFYREGYRAHQDPSCAKLALTLLLDAKTEMLADQPYHR